MLAKCVLVVTGAEAKEACRTEQLYGGLEAGIEGGTHAVRLLWQQHDQGEDWGYCYNMVEVPYGTTYVWTE